jgi:hypothetical protein
MKRFAIYRRSDKTMVEGGFSTRAAAEDYLVLNYGHANYYVAVQA